MTHAATNSTQRTPKLQLKFDPEDVLAVMDILPRDRVLDLMENSGPGSKLAVQERILCACHLSPLAETCDRRVVGVPTICPQSAVPEPPTRQPNGCPADSRQPSSRGALLAYRLSNSAHHGHCGPPSYYPCAYVAPPSSLFYFYWSRARHVRLPLLISPFVNARAHRFGGFGLNWVRVSNMGGLQNVSG